MAAERSVDDAINYRERRLQEDDAINTVCSGVIIRVVFID